MFCSECGAKIEGNQMFCPNCGARLDHNEAQQGSAATTEQQVGYGQDTQGNPFPYYQDNDSDQGQTQDYDQQNNQNYGAEEGTVPGKTGKKLPVKKIVFGVAAVVVVILAFNLIKNIFFGNSGYSVVYFYDDEADKTYFYVGTKEIGDMDGSVANGATNMNRDAKFVISSDGTAYYISKSSVNKIIDDCEGIAVAANSKAALVYDNDGKIYLYTCSGKKTKEITQVDDDEDISAIAISGNGKSYSYTVMDEDYDYVSYIGKKLTKAKDVSVLAMSKNGKYIYGRDEDGNLVLVSSKGETTKISGDLNTIVGLNESGTEIMFTTDDYKTYVSVKGGERKKVSSDYIYYVYYKTGEKIGCGYVMPVSSFKKSVAAGSNFVCILNSSYEAEKLVSGFDQSCVSSDLKYLYYLDDDELYRIELKTGKKAKEISDDVETLCDASSNGKNLYYISDETLYYVKGTGKPKAVKNMDEVESISGFFSGTTFYARVYDGDDRKLYAISGKTAKEITDDEDISLVMVYYDYTSKIYAYDDEDDKLYTISGKKLKTMDSSMESVSYGNLLY